jgi:hypothetical protein
VSGFVEKKQKIPVRFAHFQMSGEKQPDQAV